MNEENPGVDMFKKDVDILPGGQSAAKMKDDMTKMAELGNKFLAGETGLTAEEKEFTLEGRDIRFG